MKQNSYIQYNFWKYILVFLIPLIVWSVIYSDIDNLKYDEVINVLYIGDTLNAEELEKELNAALPSLTSQKIKSVYVTRIGGSLENVEDYLRNKIFSTDIVIIQEGLEKDYDAVGIFSPLTVFLKNSISNDKYYLLDGKEYGFLLDENSRFSKYCEGNIHIALFSPYSYSISSAYGYGGEKNDGAIKIMEYINETVQN